MSSRPKTAGRDAERPPTAKIRPNLQRPQSRLSMPPPSTALGQSFSTDYKDDADSNHPNLENENLISNHPFNREQSRFIRSSTIENNHPNLPRAGSTVYTSIGTRTRTAGSSTISNGFLHSNRDLRPVTQQGVSGVHTLHHNRVSTAFCNRQIADKTYFIGCLNNQLKLLQDEIDSLSKEWDKTESKQKNLLIYEQRAEEQANELKQLQMEMSNLNVIIDRQINNSDLRDLEFEMIVLKKSNQELSDAVEELFCERRKLEDLSHDLKQKINEARKWNAQKLNNLNPDTKEEIRQLQSEAEELRQKLDERQRELDKLNNVKDELNMALVNLPLKQQAMILEEQIRELEEKKLSIMSDLNSDATPEQLRQDLIQKIQKDNEEIALMQVQMQEINERISQAQEEINEFANEFEVLASDKSERYRELRSRDAHIDAFLDSFDDSKAKCEQSIVNLSQKVVNNLQLISINCRHIDLNANVADIDNSFLNIKNSDSVPKMQDLYVQLQEELMSMQRMEVRLSSEFDAMYRKQNKIDAEQARLDDSKKFEKESNIKTGEEKKQNLNNRLAQLSTENSDLLEKIVKIERLIPLDSINSQQQYTKLQELKNRVVSAQEERQLLIEKIKAQQEKNNFETIKKEALKLCAKYNALLTSTTLT